MSIDTIKAIILISIGICLFLLLREFFCWYYKINHVVVLLKSIDDKLGLLVNQSTQKNSSNEKLEHSDR